MKAILYKGNIKIKGSVRKKLLLVSLVSSLEEFLWKIIHLLLFLNIFIYSLIRYLKLATLLLLITRWKYIILFIILLFYQVELDSAMSLETLKIKYFIKTCIIAHILSLCEWINSNSYLRPIIFIKIQII